MVGVVVEFVERVSDEVVELGRCSVLMEIQIFNHCFQNRISMIKKTVELVVTNFEIRRLISPNRNSTFECKTSQFVVPFYEMH